MSTTLFAKLTAGGFNDPQAESGRAAQTRTGVFGHTHAHTKGGCQ